MNEQLSRLLLFPVVLLALVNTHVYAQNHDNTAAANAIVESGKQVSIELSVTTDDGDTHLDNTGKDPLVYHHGQSELFPALEDALTGLKVNESKTIKLTALEAFGMSDPGAFVEVNLDTVPEEARTVGTLLQINDRSGNPRMIRVHEISDDKIVLDFNHPLAGKSLTVTVRILAIE